MELLEYDGKEVSNFELVKDSQVRHQSIQHIQRVCTPSVSSCGVIPAVLSSQEMGAYLAGPPPTQAQTCLTAFLVHWHSLLEF